MMHSNVSKPRYKVREAQHDQRLIVPIPGPV